MKIKLTLLIGLTLITMSISAQKTFIHLSGQAGMVVNSRQDRKLGLGGTAALLVQDDLISGNGKNLFTISLKAFNNPFGDGKFVSSIMNGAGDAFNYVGLLAGYRLTTGNAADGFYAEPRLGLGGYSGMNVSVLFSPVVGYAYRNFDFSTYCDMGFGNLTYAMGSDQFFTVGVSVGYNIGI